MAFLALAVPAAAQDKGKAANEALRRLQQQNRALAQDKARLADEKAKAEQERERLEKEAKGAAARAVALGRDLRRAEESAAERQAAIDVLAKEKAQLAARVAELEKLRDALVERVRAAEAERDLAQERLSQNRMVIARQAQALQARDESHRKLEALAAEVVERFRGGAARVGQVEIDNQASRYRDRIDALRLDTKGR